MTKPLDLPTSRSLRGRLGAAALHSRYPAAETTLVGRRTFLSRFEREVDPDGVLPEDERLRRADHAKLAYFLRLAIASVKARATRKAAAKVTPIGG